MFDEKDRDGLISIGCLRYRSRTTDVVATATCITQTTDLYPSIEMMMDIMIPNAEAATNATFF